MCDWEADFTVRESMENIWVSFSCIGKILEWSGKWLSSTDCRHFGSSFDNGNIGYELSWCCD